MRYLPMLYKFRRAMQHRAEVYSCTMPYTLIDTAGQFNFSCSEDFAGLVSYQMKYGIPSIGNAKYIRCHRFFQPVIYREMTDADYDLISRAFRIHRSNNGIK